MSDIIDGTDLIDMGFKPGKDFPEMLRLANIRLDAGSNRNDIAVMLAEMEEFQPIPTIPLKVLYGADIAYNIDADETNEYELSNLISVRRTMDTLMRTPVTVKAAVMPDAMPAGPEGTIPVGGVVASTEIHPGMHSSDICCSLFYTEFENMSPENALSVMHEITHFGPGGRDRFKMPDDLERLFRRNKFLCDDRMVEMAHAHMGTQGDGNHFAYVGSLLSNSNTVMVTHHGSRGPGALLYKRGKTLAEANTRVISPETLKQNAWIEADSDDGREYWEALQLIREWTHENHRVLHEEVFQERVGAMYDESIVKQFWNEHNFVFRKDDGLYYHAKGSTPAFDDWAYDSTEHTIIPLNMTEPILIVKGKNNPDALGFSPHGAGRNYSRTEHKRIMAESGLTADEILEKETGAIDARFFGPNIDVSELPSAYKNAAAVKEQIIKYDLAEIVDEVLPHGCIMAGEWKPYKPEDWRRK